jgi:hypothetical protein
VVTGVKPTRLSIQLKAMMFSLEVEGWKSPRIMSE